MRPGISSLGCLILLAACASAPPESRAPLPLVELSIAQAQDAMRTGHMSCEGLIRGYLRRIKHYDPSSQLNAIVRLNPKALPRARQLDANYRSRGVMEPLHCAPVILKDNIDTADMATEAGAVALQGSIPPDDAFVVQRLRAADAIIIAKSNMGEWGFSAHQTISSTHGETRNAYDLTRVPAGSSGGSAAAIAANFGIVGMGTDTGNSIRGTASHAALVGLRPSIGLMSRDGIVPLLSNRDIAGPLTRSVADAATVLGVLAAYDPADPITQPAKMHKKADYTRYLDRDGLRGVRLGVLRDLYDTLDADPEILRLMEQALADLRKAGAVLIDPFEIEDFEALSQGAIFCNRFRYDLNRYLRSLGPSAPLQGFDELIAKQRFLRQSEPSLRWAASMDIAPQAQTPPCTGVQGDPRRRRLLNAVVTAMDSHRVDAILYPSWRNPPRKLGDLDSPHGDNSSAIAPHTGQPAITVPMGFSHGKLPAGLQFLARPFEDHKLLQYAYAYEQATKHRRPPPGFGALRN